MATIRGHASLILALPVVLVFLLTHGATAIAASPPATPADRLQLVRLAAVPPAPDSTPGSVHFEAQVNYTLSSASAGYLALFVVGDEAKRATPLRSDPVPIKAGSGRAAVGIQYLPAEQVKMVTMLVGLFTEENRLLGWVTTNQMPLASWTTRIEFQQAMTARSGGHLAEAVDHLSAAIEASEDTGNLYYWRADTQLRLRRFDEAIADYTKALALMPQDRASMVGRGVALLWKSEFGQAVEELTAALAVDGGPDDVTAWAYRARGIANADLGRIAEAINDYEAYLALNPDASDRTQVEGWIAQLRAVAESGG